MALLDGARRHVSHQGDRGVLAWLAAVVIGFSLHPSHHLRHHHRHARQDTPRAITRQVFGGRASVAWCIAYFESRHQLHARNGQNLGPWQISVSAHPWVNQWLLLHSWRYSARVAYRISHHGTDWSAWTTHSLCGV